MLSLHFLTAYKPIILTKNHILTTFSQEHFQSWTRQRQQRKLPILRVAIEDRRRRQLLCWRPTIQIWIRMTTVVIGKKHPHPHPPPLESLLHDPDHHHQGMRRSARCVWIHCKWMPQRIIVWYVVGKEYINIAVLAYVKVQ